MCGIVFSAFNPRVCSCSCSFLSCVQHLDHMQCRALPGTGSITGPAKDLSRGQVHLPLQPQPRQSISALICLPAFEPSTTSRRTSATRLEGSDRAPRSPQAASSRFAERQWRSTLTSGHVNVRFGIFIHQLPFTTAIRRHLPRLTGCSYGICNPGPCFKPPSPLQPLRPVLASTQAPDSQLRQTLQPIYRSNFTCSLFVYAPWLFDSGLTLAQVCDLRTSASSL